MESGKVALVLKWVGYLTAIIALFTGIRGIVKLVSDRAESARQVDSLLASEVLQLQAHDYQAAWQSLQQASQIKPDSPKVQSAQETLAMIWLQNIIVSGNQKFSDITEKLEPVLTRGVAASKPGSKQAELLAHLGWTYFLHGREGHPNLDPVASYAKAVEEDPDNPYGSGNVGALDTFEERQPQRRRTAFLVGSGIEARTGLRSRNATQCVIQLPERGMRGRNYSHCHSDEKGRPFCEPRVREADFLHILFQTASRAIRYAKLCQRRSTRRASRHFSMAV